MNGSQLAASHASEEYDRWWRGAVEEVCGDGQSCDAGGHGDRSETILNAFMANAPVGMYVKDSEGRYLIANPEMRKVFGREPAEVIGKSAADLFGDEEAEMIAGHDRDILASGLPKAAIEHLPGIDDFEWSLVMRFPIRNGSGKAMIGGFDIDITKQKRAEEQLQAAREAHEAQTRALRYQLNPHFLFNTLSSIATLVADGQASAAESMVLKLARFYRSSFELDPTKKIPLKQELFLQSLYFQVESVRFPDRLEVEFDVEPNVELALVPCLLLQPLIENSIEYGMRAVGHVLHIKVAAREEGGRLHIHVEDNGRGDTGSGGSGVGLELTKRRLASAFGGQFSFKAEPGSADGFHVYLSMPLELGSKSDGSAAPDLH